MALADDDVRFSFDREIGLRTLAAGVLPLRARRLAVSGSVELAGEMAFDDWTRLLAAGGCQLDEVAPPPGFEPGRPVHLRLRLRRGIAARFDDADRLADALLADAESPLRHGEAWVAQEATQRFEVPGVEGGWTEIGWRREV